MKITRAMKRTAILLALAALLLLTGVALANGTPAIDWDVIGGGGGHVEAGVYALDGTIGQAVVGTATDTGSELCSGFWCGAAVEYKIYLPLVLRNY
jgi:hypothetical protein